LVYSLIGLLGAGLWFMRNFFTCKIYGDSVKRYPFFVAAFKGKKELPAIALLSPPIAAGWAAF
jgi:hypothetical protein